MQQVPTGNSYKDWSTESLRAEFDFWFSGLGRNHSDALFKVLSLRMELEKRNAHRPEDFDYYTRLRLNWAEARAGNVVLLKQLEAQEEAARQYEAKQRKYRAEYPLKFPNHCKFCGGWGVEERDEMTRWCSHCVERSRCPRCAELLISFGPLDWPREGEEPLFCGVCGWDETTKGG